MEGFEGAGSFWAYRMMTDGTHSAIAVGDRITDEDGLVYEVRGKSISEDLTGIHHQYLLVIKHT